MIKLNFSFSLRSQRYSFHRTCVTLYFLYAKVQLFWGGHKNLPPCFDVTKQFNWKVGYFFQISWPSHNILITRHFQFLQKNYRYVKGLISVSAMGEHCVLATNFEDNGGSISDSNYTLLLCNALGTPIDSKQVLM